MEEGFKVGDNVLVQGVAGEHVTANTPGVIVGYMIRYPDTIDPSTVLAGGDEIKRCAKVYDLAEVVPEGSTIGDLVSVELDTLIKDTVKQVILDKHFEDEIRELKVKEIKLLGRMEKLEAEMRGRGLNLEDIG